ncbi:hypothetical protein D068_cds16560 [Bacillus atrophaeus UCMB-5137]|nr:hypothetical protein D068_cds16560 [Bacillus atrophaeus UCMB-5137]
MVLYQLSSFYLVKEKCLFSQIDLIIFIKKNLMLIYVKEGKIIEVNMSKITQSDSGKSFYSCDILPFKV